MNTRFSNARVLLALIVVAVAVGSLGVPIGLLLGIPVAGVVFLDHAIKAAAFVAAASLYLGGGSLPCLVAATGLSLEYLVRLWTRRRSKRLAPYQFTLAELMFVITCTAMVLSLTKILGRTVSPCLAVGLVWIALTLEPIGDSERRVLAERPGRDNSDPPRRPLL